MFEPGGTGLEVIAFLPLLQRWVIESPHSLVGARKRSQTEKEKKDDDAGWNCLH
jgi:hypothetical protein